LIWTLLFNMSEPKLELTENRWNWWTLYDTHIPKHKKLFSWFHWVYVSDYIAVIIFFIVGAIVESRVPAHQRITIANDPSLSYPLEDDIFPIWLLLLLSFAIPVAVFALAQFIYKSTHDFHHATLGLFVSLTLTYFFTDIIKVFAGRQRPDYFAMINAGNIQDAQESFPSGHSSFSFAAFTFLSLYISGKSHVYSDENGGHVFKFVFSLLPLVLCTSIAVTRTVDYHHNFSDILAGALLGAGLAIPSYFLYYPSLLAAHSHIPKLRKKYGNQMDTKLTTV